MPSISAYLRELTGNSVRIMQGLEEEPVVIVAGTFHYIPNITCYRVIENLMPRLVLSEDLVDSTYRGSKKKFEHGRFYRERAKPEQRMQILHAPAIDYADMLKIDAIGIDNVDSEDDTERELNFFRHILSHAREGGLVFAEVGLYHTTRENSALVRELEESEFTSAVINSLWRLWDRNSA